jgi:F-type H+-transporting ATPase subunit alpha
MMELLKQGIYAPVPVESQICAIYAGSKGFLDTIDTAKVSKFEADLYTALEDEKQILVSIKREKQITEDTEKNLVDLITKVVEIYK